MEALHMEITLNEEQKEYRQKCIEACQKDEDVKVFLKENGLDDTFIQEHSSKLLEWSKDRKICAQCPGLFACQFDQGRVFELVMMDGYLSKVYSKCRYLKKEEEKNQYLKNYLHFHGNDDMKMRDFKSMDQKSKELVEAGNMLLKSETEPKGVYLYGKPGVGKTYLMNALGNWYVKKGEKICFVNSPTLMSELKTGFGESGRLESILSKLKKCDVLILDDIGGESITGWSRDEILMPLLNERMEKGRKTYFTSNYSFDELEEHFSIDSRGNKDAIKANRLIERVKALSVEKNLKGANRRL